LYGRFEGGFSIESTIRSEFDAVEGISQFNTSKLIGPEKGSSERQANCWMDDREWQT
jgi:hypothetical protein